MAMDSPDFVLLSSDQTLTLRETHISGACKLHFGQKPVKIVRSEAQFLYDDTGQKYLDCTSRTTNVGHCHPETVRAACNQFMKLTVCNEHPSNKIENRLDYEYCQELLSTLPDNFQVCLFTNSGAEANDLALKLARNYTGKNDVVVVDGSFHGAVNLLWDISPKTFKQFHPDVAETNKILDAARGLGEKGFSSLLSEALIKEQPVSIPSSYSKNYTCKPPWVHVVPCPDMYRGPYAGHPDAAEKYFQQAKAAIDLAVQRNASIGCFLSEPVFIVHGVLIPPPGWLKRVYSYIRELGGVVIADEIQCGLGRSGSHFWAFQTQDAIPDILTLGKPLGNGHPVGCVVTSKKIAASLWPEDKSTYECNPVAAEVGLAVLRLMQRENFMENSFLLGLELTHGFKSIQPEHTIIGDVRGLGLMVAVDIVWTQESKKPAPELAEVISYRMKDEYILVANEGEYGNVLFFITPLCVTSKDIQVVIQVFHKIVTDVETADMAVRVSRVSLLFFGVAALTTSFVLVQAAPLKETAEIDEVNLNTRDLNVDDGNSLETRDLWDTLGLSGVVSSPSGFKDFANNFGDEDQDFSNVVFDSGNGGTQDSFNNFGGGNQNFSGAVFNTGGKGRNGGTKGSFNNGGGGTQLFGRGAKFNLGPTTDSFNNSGPGKQTGLDTATFVTGPVRNSFNGRNAPPGSSGEPAKGTKSPKKPQPASSFSLFSWLGW